MTRESMAERQVRTEEQLKAVVAALATLTQQGHEAAESRKRGYEAAEQTRLEIHDIKHRLDGLEKSVADIRPTTTELERVRDRVIFAGSLGKMMWGVGKALLSAAAGAAGYWYIVTGRTPP
jgi:hypothetical protein